MSTILIVEDYVVTQRVLSLTLRNQGYFVVVANNGVEALQCLEEGPIDLVLSDIAMPQMNGLDMLRAIRADERFASLPVVMITASGQIEDRNNALSLGADGFLTKPASSQELLDIVRRFTEATVR
jgi:CheY-like chemotaxis protein